jgi:hypothetical protein
MAFARSVLLLVITLVVAACSNAGSSVATATGLGGPYSIPNEGGAMEGHTPTGFAGVGTGLFAGDNLNPSFPDGVGVQLYLTFAIPGDPDIGKAQITSDALHLSGTPFEDLGPLLAEPVAYDSFGPELFDLSPIGPHSECTATSTTSIACDVTSAVQAAVDRGADLAQFRLRLANLGDSDGQQDLVMFFRSDSNTNEAGLIELVITP